MVCFNSFDQAYQNKLKLALIGQSIFGQEVYNKLRKEGHKVVGVFTVPDKNGQADPLGKCNLNLNANIYTCITNLPFREKVMSIWELLAYFAFITLNSAQELCLNENTSPRTSLTLLIKSLFKFFF